jgi:tetratricopeptide (TPR) repeat protein
MGAMKGGAPGMGGGMGAMKGGAPGGAPAAAAAPGAAPAGGSAGSLTTAAIALKHKGDYKGAAEMFSQAIDKDGRDADAHWGMAWTMAQLGKKADDKVMLSRAKEEFTRFITLSKDSAKVAEAKAALGRLGGGS